MVSGGYERRFVSFGKDNRTMAEGSEELGGIEQSPLGCEEMKKSVAAGFLKGLAVRKEAHFGYGHGTLDESCQP